LEDKRRNTGVQEKERKRKEKGKTDGKIHSKERK
jgi:hypothetical protein